MLSDRVKKMLLLGSMYVAFYKKQDHRDRKQIGGCQRLGVEEKTDYKGGQRMFWLMKLFCILTEVVVTQNCMCLSNLTELSIQGAKFY